MTTKITITNDDSSNGDVIIAGASTWTHDATPKHPKVLFPGESAVVGITDSSIVTITERWPSEKPKPAPEPEAAIDPAKELGA
jgi:hypothetical protein